MKKQSEDLKEKMTFIKAEHKLKMERLEYERESARRFHENALTRERIKSAEIRKSQLRRSDPYKS